jgi:hypothetical protein
MMCDQVWGVCAVRVRGVGRFEGISDIRPRPVRADACPVVRREPVVDLASNATGEVVEPSSVVAAMASAVDRVRRMATTVFRGDAALFEDRANDASN